MKNGFWKTVILSWLLVGSLDITAAFINYYSRTGKDPRIVLNYIASAVFGDKAYDGSNATLAYGLLFHFIVAFAWTLLFFIIYPRLKLHRLNRILVAILYGIVIWLVMNLAILPLTKAATGSIVIKQALIGTAILIAAIGLPLSFIAYRFSKRTT